MELNISIPTTETKSKGSSKFTIYRINVTLTDPQNRSIPITWMLEKRYSEFYHLKYVFFIYIYIYKYQKVFIFFLKLVMNFVVNSHTSSSISKAPLSPPKR